MNYYIGLDNGGTMTKAALYTSTGKEVGVCSVETKMITPKPGFTERDMEEMWLANCKVLKDLLSKTKVDASDVAGIACCGHGKGLYLWDKDNKPVRNGIISTDNRAYEYPKKWEKDGTAQKVFELSYQKILACQPVSLLAWLKDNEPESIKSIRWIFECKDYVRFRLTGEAYGEITDYSGANFLNLQTRRYDADLLKLFGLEFAMEMLPPLKNSTDICGYITSEVAKLTGLKAGTPVAGGMFDIDACAIAVDAAHEDRICMIAGTWSINEYIRREAVTDGSVMMNSIFCLPEYYLIEECSPTSAGNNEWFINTLLPELKAQAKQEGKSIYELVNTLVASIPVKEFCPIFLPFLMASNVHPNAKASFVGLSNYHTRAHLMRSVYEGIAFSHRYHFDKLLATRNQPVKEIRLAGGVANSKEWTQLFADVMKYPVETVDIGETGALGCAMTAAVAVGEFKNFEEAAKHMIKVKNRMEPNPQNVPVYEKKYALYKQVISALDGVWDNMQKLM
ncbi:MAG: carbohydrate kinase [Prolixibacteraceae bacterium]|jgi:L-xylulokinase|nr:carbohydrate kinase [Prolixibacteraceae bacterium]